MGVVLASVVAAIALWGGAPAASGSLYQGPPPRPGPDILYRPPASAPQLENRGIWRAAPILISGASAYRQGEFLYQDFLYDDHGAHGGSRDPGDPRTGEDSFSAPNGTYTYPTNPVYANNAADLVELRVKPLANATAFRITLNTLKDPASVATTIAIGGSAQPRNFPHGANVRAPAALFLTVHGLQGGARARQRLEGDQAGAAGVDRRAAAPDPGPRLTPRLGPGQAPSAPRRRGRALEQGGRAVSRARRRRHRDSPRRRCRPRQSRGLLQRRLPLPRALAAHVPAEHRFQRPSVVARPPAGQRARRQRSRPLLRQGRFRQARGRGHGQPVRQARRRAAHRPHGPDPRQPFRDQAGRRLLDHLRQRQRLPGRAPRAAPALCDLRPQGSRSAGWLRPHPAAPLARRQLQPVRREPQPVAARRARSGVDRDHARGTRPRRLVLRPRGSRHLRGLGRCRQPLPARSALDGDLRLLDGRLRHLQVRDPVSGPVRAGEPRRSGRQGSASGCRPLRRNRAARRATPTACWARYGTSPS